MPPCVYPGGIYASLLHPGGYPGGYISPYYTQVGSLPVYHASRTTLCTAVVPHQHLASRHLFPFHCWWRPLSSRKRASFPAENNRFPERNLHNMAKKPATESTSLQGRPECAKVLDPSPNPPQGWSMPKHTFHTPRATPAPGPPF